MTSDRRAYRRDGDRDWPFAGGFVRGPKLLAARRCGEIDHFDQMILDGFYELASRKSNWVIGPFTLEQIAEMLAWPLTLDTLYRRLTKIRSTGWIDYPTRPGKKHHKYLITLLGNRRERSEHGPSTPPLNHAGTGTAATHDDPSVSPAGPKTEQASNRLQAPVADASEHEPIRASRDLRDKTTTLSEGKALGEASPDHAYEVAETTPGAGMSYDVVSTHGAGTFATPPRAREEQKARDIASLSSLPAHQCDLVTELITTLDARLVPEDAA